MNNEVITRFDIYDTAGGETYRSFTRMYCRNKPLAIICYAVDSLESFKNLGFWIDFYRGQSLLNDPKLIIVRTKEDLVNQTDPVKRVDENIAQRYADEWRAPHIKTSARSGDGIDDLEEEHVDIVNRSQSKSGCSEETEVSSWTLPHDVWQCRLTQIGHRISRGNEEVVDE
jgi:GTPase SAR1 family protein